MSDEQKSPPKNAEFFFATLDSLKPGASLPITIYLYFKRNDHMLAWIKTGDTPPEDRLARYRSRGLKAIWIKNSDKEIWEKYCAGPAEAPGTAAQLAQASDAPSTSPQMAAADAAAGTPELAPATAANESATPELAEASTTTSPTPELAPATAISAATPQMAPRSEKAENIIAQLEAPATDPKLKAARVAREARKSLEETLNNAELAKQATLNQETRAVAKEVLSTLGTDVAEMINEVWKLADLDPTLTHSVNVASYSVLFALGFGKVEPALLTDLARAGLFHDFGVSQIPAHIAQKAWSEHTEEEHKIYKRHVAQSVTLARQFDSSLSERSLMMIGQTHEKFNGKGYPNGLEGFKLDPSAQVVAIAEMLDSIASGAYDGARRTYQEAFMILEKVEQNTNFPEYFNPDIFRTVLKWVKRPDGESAAKEALALVQAETASVIADAKPKAA